MNSAKISPSQLEQSQQEKGEVKVARGWRIPTAPILLILLLTNVITTTFVAIMFQRDQGESDNKPYTDEVKDKDECQSQPCLHNGTCTDSIGSYTCTCVRGFSGHNCYIDEDECMVKPCLNYGTCIDAVDSYECRCNTGFTGDNCEIDIDECHSQPCLNNAICIDSLAGYQCACTEEYAGHHCQIRKETLVFGSIYTNVTLSSVPSLNAVTGCVWLRSLAGATIVSYAVSDNDNELMIAANREKMSLGIRDEFEKRRVDLSDTVWRHLCVTWSSMGGVWKMYLNGASFTSGTDLESGKTVAGGGLLVLGQDQDSLGGGYDAHQALIGSLTEFNMWSRVLSDDEILAVANDCSIGGDVFTWYNVSLHIEGDVSLATSDICQDTPQ